MSTTENEPTTTATAGRLPTSTLFLGAGGVLLILGAFLPWVTVAELFGISGINARYGLLTLLIGLLALVVAFGAGRVFTADKAGLAAKIAAGFGLVALALSLYVGFAIRDSLAEDEVDDTSSSAELDAATEDLGEFGIEVEDFAQTFADALAPTTGVGVYTTALGGALMLAGGAMAARRS